MPLIQDLVLGGASAVFALLLVPTLLDREARVPLATSLTTGILLAIDAGVYFSLGLVFATITTALTAATWLLIARFRRTKRGMRNNTTNNPTE